MAAEPERRRLLWLMAEFFRTIGCSDIKARLPGYAAPAVLAGTLEDHRPDLTCRQSNQAKTPIILEAVSAQDIAQPKADHRWTLMYSAAKLYGAELHFVVNKWSSAGSGEQLLRRRLERLEVNPHRIWAV